MAIVLALLCSLSSAAALVRFYRARITRDFPWFSAYLLATIIQCFGLYWPTSTRTYGLWWLVTTLIMIGLRAVIVVELWRSLMSGYIRIHTIAGALAWGIFGIAVGLSGLTGFEFFMEGFVRPGFYRSMSLVIRFDSSVLAIACGCLAYFSAVFHAPVSRNLAIHARLLTGYFAGLAMFTALIHLNGGRTGSIGIGMVLSTTAFHVLWACLMRRCGRRAGPWLWTSPDRLKDLESRDRALYSAGAAEL